MINLDEKLEEIVSERKCEITTKELNEKGINKYYIKKALDTKALEKISRGKYRVTAVAKENRRINSFNTFVRAVFSNDFEKAYDNLLISIENQTNHDYEYHIKLYSLLLKELLPSDKDFSFVDELLTFCDNSKNETYFEYFIKFTEAVLSSDFEKAYRAIGRYRQEEKLRKKNYALSTKLFTHLTYNIHKQKQEENKSCNSNSFEKSIISKENFKKFKKEIEEDNYEEALKYLEVAIENSTGEVRNNLGKMYNILTEFLEIKATKKLLPEQEIDYSEYQDDYNKIFNKALELMDFKIAYRNIGKCIYSNKKSMTLELYKHLLEKLIDEDKKNNKNNTVLKSVEPTLELVEEPTPKEEPINAEIDIEDLLDLVYARNYDEVKRLLARQEMADNRLYRNIISMIRYMDNIRSSNNVREQKLHFYVNDCTNCFKRFFEALNYRCYEEAFNLVDECIELAKRNDDSEKFIIYKYILEDIINLKEEIISKTAEIRKLNELTKIQKSIIPKHVLRTEDLERLENATLEKIELSIENDISYDKHIVEMLETLRNIDIYNLDNNSFEKFEYSEQDILNQFLAAINLGDYQEAYRISREEKWYHALKKSENKDYLIIYKKLLSRINRKIEDNSIPVKTIISEVPLEEKTLIEQLATLKTLVKKREYVKAYNYYQENELEGISAELDLILQTFFPFIIKTVENQSIEIENEYKDALNREDYEAATKYLTDYENFIQLYNLDRNINYQKNESRLEEKQSSESDKKLIKLN